MDKGKTKEPGDKITKGEFCLWLGKEFKGYKIFAFPGPNAIEEGRMEHLPLHIHVRKNGEEYRIQIEEDELYEMRGLKIPKDLRRYLIKNKEELVKKTQEVFDNGRYS